MPNLLSLVSSGVRLAQKASSARTATITTADLPSPPPPHYSSASSSQAPNGVNTGLNNQADNYKDLNQNQQRNNYQSTETAATTAAYELYGSEVTPSHNTNSNTDDDNNNNNNGNTITIDSTTATDENNYISASTAAASSPQRLEHPAAAVVRQQRQQQQDLPYPVIIPQRRPEAKERGFLYAYATVLNECGIDEETFLEFLRNLNQACKTSKIFDAVNYGGLAAGMVPNISTQFYGIAASLAAKSSKWMQSGHKVNQYLYQMNEELFKPHGLLCLIMTYKPPETEQRNSRTTHLINSTTASMKTHVQSLFGPMEMSSGTSEPMLPDHATLIFPENAPKSRLGGMGARHTDQQAQVEYTRRVRALKLDQASCQLAALYPIEDDENESQPYHQNYLPAENTRLPLVGSRRTQLNAIAAAVRDRFKQEMLYLMIVNLPTREELDAAVNNGPRN